VLYVSRGHLGDVAAFEVASGELLWRVSIGGFRADHMTISDDGRRLYVSAMTDNRVEVVDTELRAIVGSFATGQWPHDNVLSGDGERVYNGSIGNILVPPEARDGQPDAADPLLAAPYRLTIADASSLDVLGTFDFPAGIRPFVLADGERRMYAQLSELHGLVEVDLEDGRELRRLELPVDDGVTSDDYDFEAPHHGLELSGDGETLCVAGRASDYVALVSRERMEATAIVDVGDAPSWAANSPDGRHCFVASTRDGTVSVISYESAREVARIPAGQGPKYLTGARVPADAVVSRRSAGTSAR
jgi:YVTN family beta-propeller protein